MTATAEQIRKLQVLYKQFASSSLDAGDGRGDRLAWASTNCRRPIVSFSDLSADEASALIDTLLRALNLSVTAPKRQRGGYKKISDAGRAQRAGTAGRRGHASKVVSPASADDLARIEQDLEDLGWTRERLDAFLRSSSSPLGKRANPAIRTDEDANRVHWALKRMRDRAGRAAS